MVIEVNNSYSQVRNFDKDAYKRLREALSYDTDPGARYFAGGRYPTKRYLIDRKGIFPTGLLERVLAAIPTAGIKDLRKRPTPNPTAIQYIGPKPRPEQTAAADIKQTRYGIEAATGSGKSVIIALIAAKLGLKTLVVVPNLGLKEQLKNSLQRCLKPSHLVTVENIDSPRLKEPKSYDLLIIDEAHHAAAATYRNLNKTVWKDIYYRVFLTGTFYRNQESEALLFEGICGKPQYHIPYKLARDKGYILPVEAWTIKLPKQKTDAYTWAQVYSELVVNNEYRNAQIANLLLRLSGKYSLCLVKEIRHGEILSEMTGIPFANGQTEGSSSLIKDLCSGKITQLIATTGVCGEGVDTVPVEYVIIAGLGKAKSAFQQQVGRGVRPHPSKDTAKVIIFKDSSHKFCLRHYNAQVKILVDDYGAYPLELKLTEG